MIKYRAGLAKRADGVDAWVFELPGCRAVGINIAEAVELLPLAIAEHIAWLRSHGEQLDNDFDYEVTEEKDALGEIVFEADAEPLTNDEVETGIRRMGYSQQDILAIAGPLPQRLLEWRPPSTSVKADERVPDPRTMREMLEHAAGAETYFLRNIIEPAPASPPPSADFEAGRRATLEHLRALDLGSSGAVYKHQGPRGEAEWSARKVIRRIINHQRFHAREVEQRLCWLALGVPDVIPANRE